MYVKIHFFTVSLFLLTGSKAKAKRLGSTWGSSYKTAQCYPLSQVICDLFGFIESGCSFIFNIQ